MHGVSAQQVFSLLRPHQSLDVKTILHASNSNSKDVMVAAFVQNPVPLTKEKFLDRQTDGYYRLKVLVCAVDVVDQNNYGWSKAPFDCKKTLNRMEQEALYTVDEDGEHAGKTRFWSFKKVSNNMNKGVREQKVVDGNETTFVVPDCACLTFFLREEQYKDDSRFFDTLAVKDSDEESELKEFAPVILHLSGNNVDQTLTGNGLKLRRIVAQGMHVAKTFSSCLPTSKQLFFEAQMKATNCHGVKKMLAVSKQAVIHIPFNSTAFLQAELVEDEWIEICEPGVDVVPAMGQIVLVHKNLVLQTLHTENVTRAIRMLTIALGMGAVSAMLHERNMRVEGKDVQVALVKYLFVDFNKLLLLDKLESSRQHDATSTQQAKLPHHATLQMCFGTSLVDQMSPADMYKDAKVLQWHNPELRVILVDESGQENSYHVLIEMDLHPTQSAGSRVAEDKCLMMDDCAGLHHALRFFRIPSLVYDENSGFGQSSDATLLITWQLRPGCVANSSLRVNGVPRKRKFLPADDLDMLTVGTLEVPSVERQNANLFDE